MVSQPTGTVTLLFSDIEGSTALLSCLGAERYAEALALHDRLMRDAFERHGGFEVGNEGDSLFVAFDRADAAVAAAAEAQLALAVAAWPQGVSVRARMGVHTGEPLPVPPRYVGMDVHRAARIMAAAHGGQVLISETTRSLVVDAPMRDLGEHRLKDLLRPVRLHQLLIDGLPNEHLPPRTLNRSNLPIAAGPLLGRTRELAEIQRLVASGARLVTLTGPGGSGKTRLALQAAAELADDFRDGIYFVGLAPLRDPDAVLPALAESLELQPDDDVAGQLARSRVLLVLDNAEHLRGVEAVIVDLLVGDVVVLVTSRVPLHLSLEFEVPVEPLPENAAVELFVSRAAAAGCSLVPSAAIASVCRRLDNLPLAIELAAARSKLLSPEALIGRLDRALPLLSGGARDAPERQRTLRATMEWSYELLEPLERESFRRLSVFRGTFALDAAEAVAGADLDLVTSLVDNSLLKPIGKGRIFMLETVREFGREQLDTAGETEAYALRHGRYYLARLEEIDPVLRGPRTAEFLAWYVDEEDNLRAMLDRLATADPLDAARAGVLLASYWTARGALTEGAHRLSMLLALDPPDRERGRLLQRLGDLEGRRGNLDASTVWANEAARVAEAEDDLTTVANALIDLAWAEHQRGRSDAAVSLGERAVAVAEEHLDTRAQARTSDNLAAFLTGAERYEEARAVAQRAIAAYSQLGDTVNNAVMRQRLGNLEFTDGNYEAALATYQEAAGALEAIGHADSVFATGGTAQCLLALGRPAEAATVFSEVLDAAIETGRSRETAWALGCIALAATGADPGAAACLRGAGDELLRRFGHRRAPNDEAFEADLELTLRETLGEKAFARRYQAGTTMSLEQAVQLAHTLADHLNAGRTLK